MDSLNQALTSLTEWLLLPFRNWPATGLVLWSIVIGLAMTYVFGKTSNQTGLRRAADRIRAQLFGVKLFKEDLVVTFHCQIALLKWTAMRLWYSIPPMLVMLAPLFLVLSQLAMRYEFRPLVSQEQAVVAVRCHPDSWKQLRDELTLQDGERFDVETAGLRDEKNTTIYWRVRATGDRPESMSWRWKDQTITKMLPMAPSSVQLETAPSRRPGASLADRLLYPAEPPVAEAGGPIESIDLQLVHRETPVLGWPIPWWATFFLVSMVTAFVSGKWIGVQY